jgi:proteasome lid subunit RPN8/RPN11
MGIKLTAEQIEAIKQHGERTFPEECGGLLLGEIENDQRVIREVLPLENIRKDSRHNRVELDPLDYMKAEREAAKRSLGVWVPSGFDLDHAPFIEWSYVIVSVQAGKAADLRAWTVREDRSQFDEEEILF